MQGRIMKKINPPVRVIVPGKNFRYEQVDASHGFEFWQVEGFFVDKEVRLTDLFGTIDYVLRKLMGEGIKLKFATTNFPFVEPGAQIDIFWKSRCLEVLGAGMVHPNVFKAVGYDPEEVSGFAFGMGVERLAMVRYGVSDMRLFYGNHLDFLSQFVR
jgi:phenylalanyl-tRNA synthetase alpha chain